MPEYIYKTDAIPDSCVNNSYEEKEWGRKKKKQLSTVSPASFAHSQARIIHAVSHIQSEEDKCVLSFSRTHAHVHTRTHVFFEKSLDTHTHTHTFKLSSVLEHIHGTLHALKKSDRIRNIN